MNRHQKQDQSEVEHVLASGAGLGVSPSAVERIDTHAARVFLIGERAYKMKRAVTYPFLDFSTLERRREACLNEVRLNRRTAPEIYLGLRAVRRDASGKLYLDALQSIGDGGPARVEPNGTTVEWVVEMQRFEQDFTLDRLTERDGLDDLLLDDLARSVAAFHGEAQAFVEGFEAAGELDEIIAGNDQAFEEHRSLFSRDRSLALTQESFSLVARHRSLLARRQAGGKIRHCHGDLHLANIVAIDGQAVLFDAIEFDDRIATIDVFYDLAFLLMDFWERGREREASFVFNRYLSITADYSALPLIPLFLSLRAAIRAKVCAAQDRAEDARNYFRHAVFFLQPCPVRCIGIGGLSGSGKTRLARELAAFVGAAPGAVHLRSDLIRKEIFGMAETRRLPESAYSREASTQVYDALLARCRRVLELGHSVIVDAVFSTPGERSALAAVAGDEPDCIWLTAPDDVLLSRVTSRRKDASDATAEVVERQLRYNLGSMTWRRVNSDAAPSELVGRVRKLLERNQGFG